MDEVDVRLDAEGDELMQEIVGAVIRKLEPWWEQRRQESLATAQRFLTDGVPPLETLSGQEAEIAEIVESAQRRAAEALEGLEHRVHQFLRPGAGRRGEPRGADAGGRLR